MASGKAIVALAAIIIIVGTIIGFVSASYYSVGVSEQAIIVNGYDSNPDTRISLGAAGPIAWATKNPLAHVVTISTAIQTVTLDNDNTIGGLTSDNLNVNFDVVVVYNVRGDKVIALYKQYPTDNPIDTIQNSRIVPIIRAAVRDVVAFYQAETLQTSRAEIQSKIEARINATITADNSLVGAINVGQINLKHIGLPQSYLDAITNKLNAQQAQAQAIFEAQKTVIQAEAAANATIQQALGNARAVVIQATATQQAQIIVTNGTATAINDIARQLNLNATQRSQLTLQFTFMQQLQQLCALSTQPCNSMILFIGANGQSQIFQIPSKP